MDYSFRTIGALLGLSVFIVLIIRKIQPALGALIGGIIGGNAPLSGPLCILEQRLDLCGAV